MPPILDVRGLSKSIKRKTLISDITFRIEEGEAFGLIGPNGAGKTTLLKTLVGFYKPTTGNIFFRGKETEKTSYKNFIGFSTQEDSVYRDMTIIENILYFGHLYGIPGKELKQRAEELLGIIGLSSAKNKLSEELSGGMRKRLDIACSLINDPELLILDEPFGSLDPKQREEIWSLLAKIRESGTAVLISSHFLGDLEAFCDKLGLVVSGKMIFVGPPRDLKKNYLDKVRITIKTYPFNLSQLKSVLPYMNVVENSIVINTTYSQLESDLGVILKSLYSLNEKITFFDISEPSLDELFRKVVENA